MSAPVSLRFTETMRGFVTLDEPDPQRGYDQGRADGTALSFQLTISTDDVDAFVADPHHAAVATGHVDCDALGGRRPVAGGEFNLFVAATPQSTTPQSARPHDKDRVARRMLYRLPFADAAGHPLTLHGRKDVEDDPGFDLWRDTSTLYTRIYAGDPPTGRVVAAGIVTIHLPDFIQQLTTFRVAAPGADKPLAALRGLEKFGQLFLGELWKIYAPRAALGDVGDEPR